jgi:hypothetical protein
MSHAVRAGWLPRIRKTNLTCKNCLPFVRSICHSLGVNQAKAARSKIAVRARAPVIIDRFITRTGHITTSMVSTKYPKWRSVRLSGKRTLGWTKLPHDKA